MAPILRFAPSPNGRLHLGHAFSALFGEAWARRLGGVQRLRIEDIDTARSKPEFVAAIFEDLAWLGLDWPEPVMVQSQRFSVYARAAAQLRDRGLLYPCFCTRTEIAAGSPGWDPDGAPLYGGHCRHRSPAEVAARLERGEAAQWRLDMAAAMALAGPVAIAEHESDPATPSVRRAARPERWGDVVLVRKDTPTSYHLSVVVDDAEEAVTLVTRGMDLRAATDIHVLLQALLGLPSPAYCHHPLIHDDTGQKLAKSRRSQSLADLRAAGWTATDIRRHLGF